MTNQPTNPTTTNLGGTMKMSDNFTSQLRELAALECGTTEWRALAERVSSEAEPLVDAAARRCSRVPGTVWTRDSDDIYQIARMTHWTMLDHVGVAQPLDELIESWDAALAVRVYAAVRAWAETSAVTGLSGYSGVVRRMRSLNAVRSELESAFGQTTSLAEAVDVYNGRLAAGVGGRVHGAHATAADVGGVRYDHLVAVDELEDALDLEVSAISRVSTERIVSRCVDEAAAVDPELGEIAAVWLRSWDDGGVASIAEVVRRCGITAPSARSAVTRLRSIAQRVATEELSDASLSIVRTVAAATLADERLGAVAEIRFEAWPAGELVAPAEIAQRMQMSVADVRRALATIERLLAENLTVEADCAERRG